MTTMTTYNRAFTTADYPYRLGKQRLTCPLCGRRKVFKPYVDREGRIIDPEAGRCNREFSCGYHQKPARGSVQGGRTHLRHYSYRRPAPQPVSYMDYDLVLDSVDNHAKDTPLLQWFAARFGQKQAMELFIRMNVGGSVRMPGASVFWLVDGDSQVRSGKIMAYDANARRMKRGGAGCVSMAHSYLKKDYNYEACYFGAHHARLYSEATLMVVESEKTALYLSALLERAGCSRERYVVIATGGCSNLRYDFGRHGETHYRGRDLIGRHLVLLPDADAVERWTEYAAGLRRVAASVRVVDIRRWATGESDDIMDLLMRRYGHG